MPTMPAVRLQQGSHTLYVGSIEAAKLISIMIVDRWFPEQGWDLAQQGYQREIYQDHIIGIKSFLTSHSGEMLPTAIVATVRGEENLLLSFDGDNVGYLNMQSGCHLHIIDGQHRLLAIDNILQENPQDSLGQLTLPLVLLVNVDKVEELRQFHLINHRQRRIATNLAFALLATAAASDPRVGGTLTTAGKEWLLPATGTAIRLNEDPGSPWTGRVKYPSALGSSTSVQVATLNSLAGSLERFFKNQDRIVIAPGDVTEYLKRFWEAVRIAMPSAFESPAGYVVQRSTGVYSFNFVAYELWRQMQGLRTADAGVIAQQLSLAGDYLSANRWRRREEFATTYKGHARFRELGREILDRMGLDARRRR